MFCPFCGDQVAGAECPKPACAQRLAEATATVAVAAPPEPSSVIVSAAVEPVLAPSQAPLTVKPARVVSASVEQCMTERARLWAELDSTLALVAKLDKEGTDLGGRPAGGVTASPRITAGTDLVAELRAVEAALGAERGRLQEIQRTIAANTAEIARLNRNRMLMIGGIVVAVLIVIILIATAL